jgi:hypothetical protein
MDLLISRGELEEAYALLREPVRPEDERMRLYLLLNYYEKKKDYMSYITTAGKISFDSLSLGDPEVKIIRQLIKAFRELHLYQKALFYLHYLKGYIDDEEYAVIRGNIERERQHFEEAGAGHYLTK